ncbi:two-component sensor histidine kinase [Streptomyces spiroverticillatus]|uniref:histidine kinase n=1 Tax=Streptomyces finlayi TaxID=67296 RepID=A0A918WUD5_9ACTN|nr:HAMP domain-containing sensor histidine kinase [Streptomyces finlayi]GGZ99957.1 two-component sensor histidine kinase [Streptomyces spiroverticillatus]GHC84544.1 two-component sensor histidine kinase [Streptomyces finlayi]
MSSFRFRFRGRRAQSFRRRTLSLRARLVVSCVALVAVVAAVVGVVTSVALHSYLEGQVDEQLVSALGREHGSGLLFVAAPGQPLGTVGLRDDVGARSVSGTGERAESHLKGLRAGQVAALQGVPRDGKPHTVSVPGLGEYRAVVGSGKGAGLVLFRGDVRSDARGDKGVGPLPGPGGLPGGEGEGGEVVLGFPLAEVQDTVRTLVVVVVCVTLAALVAAVIAGNALVGAALRPLRRIAATATRVSELPLDRGEVALHERVPEAQADARTEVGQVGAALNRMLGHVGAALAVRQESEMRVRRFVADASHELRTPLASIRGYAELTRRGREAAAAGPDTRHALGRIESEAARMTGLVEDLLLLARLDAGVGAGAEVDVRAVLSVESVDLLPLVVDAVSDARAARQGHVWRLELPDEPVVVRGDAGRLQQVLVNLLGNAGVHTPEGTKVVARVGEEVGEGGGRWAVVEVRDDGPGVPPELVGRVFERFARGDVGRARVPVRVPVRAGGFGVPVRAAGGSVGGLGSPVRGEGSGVGSTGLGLAIVRAVVEAHGGRVGVESVPGCTVFSVRVPL